MRRSLDAAAVRRPTPSFSYTCSSASRHAVAAHAGDGCRALHPHEVRTKQLGDVASRSVKSRPSRCRISAMKRPCPRGAGSPPSALRCRSTWTYIVASPETSVCNRSRKDSGKGRVPSTSHASPSSPRTASRSAREKRVTPPYIRRTNACASSTTLPNARRRSAASSSEPPPSLPLLPPREGRRVPVARARFSKPRERRTLAPCAHSSAAKPN